MLISLISLGKIILMRKTMIYSHLVLLILLALQLQGDYLVCGSVCTHFLF